MKRLAISLIAVSPAIASGQYEYGFLQEFFFGRQPSARAEAMGRGYGSIDGDLTSAFYNPAGTATIRGLEMDGSFSSPYYLATAAEYHCTSVGYRISDLLVAGLSRNHFTLGQQVDLVDVNGNTISPTRPIPTTSNHALTLSSQPIKDLFLGLNTNYLVWRPADGTAATVHLDLGAIKRFQFQQKGAAGHSVNIGASIMNLNHSTITLDFQGSKFTESLPVTARYGANYRFTLGRHLLVDTLRTLGVLIQGEYQMLLNSQYHSGIHMGMEVSFLEILSIRAGHYKEKQYDYDLPFANRDEVSAITYGIGLQVPLHKLTRIPLNVNLDYASMPQPSYIKARTAWGNFTTCNLRLNWIPRNKE